MKTMAKEKKLYFCGECGYESVKWQGKCPNCKEWNSFQEVKVRKGKSSNSLRSSTANFQKINEIKEDATQRIKLASSELNRVLGGGLVPGSLVLISGEPGIGKSTLFLQLALRQSDESVLYVSGEESAEQIKVRANRLSQTNEDVYVLSSTSSAEIFEYANKLKPQYMVIDSIQTVYSDQVDSSPGSISQIRETTSELMKYSKQNNTAAFIIGHINKEGQLAGPKILEHMVDVVLQFEGDRNNDFRIIRCTKNRFGSTAEIGVYEMQSKGLTQVLNLSEILLSQNENKLSGSAVASVVEGSQALMVEVQALVSPTSYGHPQRTISGYDPKRVQLILAVLEKRLGYPFYQQDVFLSISGNIKIEDPSVELAIAAALVSSYKDEYIPSNYAFAGEVNLTGEVRPVNKMEVRINEASKIGFEKLYLSEKFKLSSLEKPIELVGIKNISELINSLF